MGKEGWEKVDRPDTAVKEIPSLEELYYFLTQIRAQERALNDIYAQKRYLYTSILLIQLINGMRIMEAVKCTRLFSNTPNERAFVITALKTRGKRLRPCYIPSDIDMYDAKLFKFYFANISDYNVRELTRKYLSRYGLRTHILRYAYINYWLRRGYSPQQISSFIGLADVRPLEIYAVGKEFEDKVREEIKNFRSLESLNSRILREILRKTIAETKEKF